ncbi:MAG: hypothetical protein F4Y11_06325 [Chloroflexi bacterium]|nr:hypothetical protein [Chloroflexota bacterium]
MPTACGFDDGSLLLGPERLHERPFEVEIVPEWTVDLQDKSVIRQEDGVGVGTGWMEPAIADFLSQADLIDQTTPD